MNVDGMKIGLFYWNVKNLKIVQQRLRAHVHVRLACARIAETARAKVDAEQIGHLLHL